MRVSGLECNNLLQQIESIENNLPVSDVFTQYEFKSLKV